MIALLPLMISLSGCTAPPGAGVVSLHDTTTEMVAALDRTDALLAVTEPGFLSPGAEAAVAGLPRLPSGALSAEAILALRPATVLGTDVITERQPELTAALERAGVALLFIDPEGLDGLWRSLEQVGAAVDAGPEAASLGASLAASLPPVTTDDALDGGPVRVFLYDCCDPPFTAGGRAPVSELLRRLGAVNVFEDLDQDWATVSWEAAAGREPELIVIHDYSWEGQAGAPEKRASLSANPWLARSDAARPEHLITMPLALALEGLRSLEALPLLAPHVAAARARRSPPTHPSDPTENHP